MDAEMEAGDGGRTLSPMELLPDELVMVILSKVQDAATLLDYVPLVCRRWHRLSGACWIDADLRLPYFNAGSRGWCVAAMHARLLQHAPPTGRLRLSLERDQCNLRTSKSVPSVRLTKALRSCTAGISDLVLPYEEPWKSEDEAACKTLLRLIEENRNHLKKFNLKISMLETWSESLGDVGLWPGLPGALLHCSSLRSLHCPTSCVSALRGMPGLAELELYFSYELDDMDGPLGMPRPEEPWPAAASLPALRSLAFKHCEAQSSGNLYPWAGELMVALCRAAPGLTRLSAVCFENFHGNSCGCAAEQLRLDEALAGVPQLHSINLHGGTSLLALLTDQPLDALVDIKLGIWCDDYGDKDFKLKVEALKAARPQARAVLDVYVMNPTSLTFEW